VFIDNVRVQSIGKPVIQEQVIIKTDQEMQQIYTDRILWNTDVYFEVDGQVKPFSTPVYDLDNLGSGFTVEGPTIILNKTSTIIVEPQCI
jgi:5-oxoprolinase (ATP-hydrolysing)